MEQGLLDRQIEIETNMRERGIARFNRNVEKAREAGRGEDTEAGIYLLKQSITPVAAAITEAIAKAMGGGAGRRATAAPLIKDVEPDLLAYMTLTSILSGIAVFKTRRLSSLVQAIASGIEVELRMADFEERKPALYGVIMDRLADRGSVAPHVKRVMNYAAGKYGLDWEGWTPAQRMHIGMFLLDAALTVLPWVAVANVVVGKNRTAPVVAPTDELLAWLKDRNEKLSVLRPVILPMVVQPREWRSLRGGGYRSDHILKTALVKRASKKHMAALQHADLTTTYTGLNAIQNTRWKINRRVLEVAQEAWQRGLDLAGIPNREDEELPPKPDDIAENEEARNEWKRAAKAVYERNVGARSGRILAHQVLATAGDLVDEDAIYFPHNLDFRGRCYARPGGLQPQGNDLCRGLLTFAEGKPLGSERAVGWLAIHGANCFGVDKVSHGERVDWVYEHEAQIMAVVKDPLGYRWWTEADSPWCFLAFCHEWVGFCREGLAYRSSLPIALDGSCNGLQHYSAMLRDPIGGAAVNLIPADTPQDIYGEVAKAVVRKLQEIARDEENPGRFVADAWARFGIDRKITKRPVMVLPYGGTVSSCRSYVIDAVREKVAGGAENPFGDELVKQASWLAGIVWESIGSTVVAARDAMDFLRKVAKVASKHEIALQWTTPSGFVARQEYKDTKKRRVETKLHGSIIKFAVNDEIDKLDKLRQSAGIPPNFVHSLDASAMMLTIEMSLHNGISSFAMIHDSYGTHAADTDILATCLRETFIDMYQENDVLAQFRDEIAAQLPPEALRDLPPLPEKGALDLAGVRESAFFFS